MNFNLRYYKSFQGWTTLKEQREVKDEERRKKKEGIIDQMAQDKNKMPPIDKYKDGPYIFMPQRDDQESKPYSKFAGIQQIQGESVSEFLIHFDNMAKKEPAKAVIRIRLDKNSE